MTRTISYVTTYLLALEMCLFCSGEWRVIVVNAQPSLLHRHSRVSVGHKRPHLTRGWVVVVPNATSRTLALVELKSAISSRRLGDVDMEKKITGKYEKRISELEK